MPPTTDGQVEIPSGWGVTVLLGPGTSYELGEIGGLGVPDVRTADLDLLGGGVYAGRDVAGPRTLELDVEVKGTSDADLAAKVSDLLTALTPWPGNLLTWQQSSLEDSGLGTTGWQGFTNCTVARSTAQAAHGSASLAITATAAGNMQANTRRGVAGVPVVPGQAYMGLVSIRPATTVRTVEVGLEWWTSSGANAGFASTTYTEDSAAWKQITHTATAPATAAFGEVYVIVQAAAASEVHYVDKASIAPGTSTTWRLPGEVDVDLLVKVKGRANNRKIPGRPRGAPWVWDVEADQSGIVKVAGEWFSPKPWIYDATTGDVVRY